MNLPWLDEIRSQGAELHLSAGLPPVKVVAGEYTPLQEARLGPEQIEAMLLGLLSDEDKQTLERTRFVRLALQTQAGTFRAVLARQRQTLSGYLRPLPILATPWEEPGLQSLLKSLSRPRQGGLVVVAGPAGSGVTTTLHALVHAWNVARPGTLVTLEDPMEFEHQDHLGFVLQRQKGRDYCSELEALRASLNQGAQGVLLGRLSDSRLIQEALHIGSLGREVWAGAPGLSALGVLQKLRAEAGDDERAQVLLSSGLGAVVCQRLLPGLMGGQVPVFEVLQMTPAVQSIVCEGTWQHLARTMETEAERGMQTLEQALLLAVKAEQVSEDQALFQANDPRRLRALLEEN